MNDIKQKALLLYEALKDLPNNEDFLQQTDWLAFIISLLPIVGLQQAGAIASKITNDRSVNVRFEQIKEEVIKTNQRIAQMESDVERLGLIASTVSNVTELQEQLSQFLDGLTSELVQDETEFVMDTSKWSTQAVMNQMIEVDWASISAKDHSQNILRNTKIQAKKLTSQPMITQ